MHTGEIGILMMLTLLGGILSGCAGDGSYTTDPNLSGVQAQATLAYVQAIQTSTAQAHFAAEWSATLHAASTHDAIQAAYLAAHATQEYERSSVAATQTQQAWIAFATSESLSAAGTAHANTTAAAWSATTTHSAWSLHATSDAAAVQAAQTSQAARAELARLAADRQRTINRIQAYAPWAILAVVVPLVAYLAWLWGQTEALRRRAIPRDPRGDAPILILDQDGQRSIIDPDLFFGAALAIKPGGDLSMPGLVGADFQAQVKARDQAIDLFNRGLPGHQPHQPGQPLLLPEPAGQPRPIRVVPPEEVKDWLSEVLPQVQHRSLGDGNSGDG
jgi:hypothetical protein